MAKYLGIIIGTISVIFGIMLLNKWADSFYIFVRGTFPFLMILCGGIAIFAGASELIDTIKLGRK